MSYPYPQDRHRDRKEKGEQPYKDAREAMAKEQAAEAGEAHHGASQPRQPSSLSRGGSNIPPEVIDSLNETTEEASHEGERGQGG